MNIVPITTGNFITPAVNPQTAKTGSEVPFKSMFTDALNNLEQLNEIKNEDNYLLSVGEIDNIGALQVDMLKAETAMQMLVEMRNKVLDGYNEIMRMNV